MVSREMIPSKPSPEYVEKRWRQVRELYNKVCKNNLRKIEQIERIILQ